MNKAITDGAQLMPPSFADAPGAFADGSGPPDWQSVGASAKLITDDPDFGVCLEFDTADLQRLRYMGETPLLPGCYLRVSARLKLMRGPAPSARIAGFAGGPGGQPVADAQTLGPKMQLGADGQITEISAIVGPGTRLGVDMVWGPDALFGHFGVDLTGSDAARVRLDGLRIEDVSATYVSQQIAQVDVRDFGASGDGKSDDSDAFEAADQAAQGRSVLVPEGRYLLGRDLRLTAPFRFVGCVVMPEDASLVLTRQFHLPGYCDAFGEPVLALTKALQALMLPDAPTTLDMKGMTVRLSEPLRLRAPQGRDVTRAARTLCNGRIQAVPGAGWRHDEASLQVDWDSGAPLVLNPAGSAERVRVGARVSGPGVAPETYVRAKHAPDRVVTLNRPLGGGSGARDLTFTRFRYLLDFSDLPELWHFTLSSLEICGETVASGVMLPATGGYFRLRNCTIRDPRDRGLTSCGEGCNALQLSNCSFLSERRTALPHLALNANAPGVRIADCRSEGPHEFGHITGGSLLMTGCHVTNTTGHSQTGLTLAGHAAYLVTGNHFENCTMALGPDWGTIEPDTNLFSI
ncbi:hypothetical protein So717_31530 [Roseobacter cerasinus]|uniref:Rhamnogalacturonase A/B/Epimerase-like pectate lyase domain-containing protein n=1 Tax=Roseobacter cerasinus TaxID=2602289 RepID=A0A640VVG5_9RHOB|nr:glycosyl hydrolase family 28-related protein [Roseobacter cerasinus]GFE51400.1 hypothetical protein So717_31530 [Roseobacter cerasinus]